ncbi:tRNA dimethylallyltransferase [Alteripontixanthobacter maritimus]|uniref:tRNA dimethylallyltransferase n=1 Tax=Alteripontixanthobacter maritimus TaxID=2161824 RepID=A0A369Q540_9SPHN|nr:tRNA dimethylallyltransferase [Alteripontixanthobacter maritimus]
MRLALLLKAQGQDAAVINADSAQVYADLRILSARPTEEEMRGVEHLLFGTWDGAQACSAADWAKAARAEIDRLHGAGSVPILCGGTGMYLRVLLDGIAPVPAIDPPIREAVRAMDAADAYAALTQEDPERAAALNPGDTQRVARALEVVRSTGKPLGYWQARLEGGIADRVALHPLVLTPPREVLRERAAMRFDAMLQAGAVTEVESLLNRKLSRNLPVMRAIGVPALAAYLDGRADIAAATTQAVLATRQYAKRQATWFNRQLAPDWIVWLKTTMPTDDDIERLFL